MTSADAWRSLGVVLVAFALDAGFGEPPAALHPVVWMGRAIAFGERLAVGRTRAAQFLSGGMIALVVPLAFAAGAWWLEKRLRPYPVVAIAASALLLKSMFALRALGRAARVVREAVAAERIDEARQGLRSLCSRDPSRLDAPALVAAAIESVAENTSDSLVAPLFWFALLGLPGAVFYRAVNTMDAMIGYHGRYEWLGKVAARLDDALNWVPARVTAWLLLGAGALVGLDARRGRRVLARDGAATESPNAGRPMAAMAGMLGVQLEKAGAYRLGDATVPLDPAQIDRAWRASRLASMLAALGTCVLAATRAAFFS